MAEITKAISIRQPWAYAIMFLGKDIENRSWRTNFRGRVFIHAGKKFDMNGYEKLLTMNIQENPSKSNMSTILSGSNRYAKLGGLVGTVEIADCVKESKSKWFQGKYGWVLRDPKPILFIPCKGKLSFFNVEDVIKGDSHENINNHLV